MNVTHGARQGATAQTPLFLRIPPFPGATTRIFAELAGKAAGDFSDHLELLRSLRVGGTFWGAQPTLPDHYLLVRETRALPACVKLSKELGEPLLWQQAASDEPADRRIVPEVCDPWHMLGRASGLVCAPDDEVRIVAAVLGVPMYLWQANMPLSLTKDIAETILSDAAVAMPVLADPFTGSPMTLKEAIRLCGFWRNLIDSNRDLSGGVGFALWKQGTVAPLLWSGQETFPFLRDRPRADHSGKLAVWRSKTPGNLLASLKADGEQMVEVEDGFLRSNGLGADCIPPLSITVDRLGPYFDPSQPSELECILQDGTFDAALLARAAALRQMVVAEGLGKYGRESAPLPRPRGAARHILVTGQVEDDRSVLTGGGGLVSNAELLKRVRDSAPFGFILYKPHPDVMAGHRKGIVPEALGRRLADRIVAEVPISSLLDMVDEVHVNTSLAGFEALLRGKHVVTHGVPFYAGWGLTEDLGSIPARRTRRRTLDELVAATLLMYPRYLDPVTGLPCPAEIVVRRLCAGNHLRSTPLVALRRMQGQVMRRFRSLVA